MHCLVEELELQLQQEQTVSHDLRTSLEAEKCSGLEQQRMLEAELKAVSVLKAELEEARLQLQSTYRNQDELKSQIHKLRYSKRACILNLKCRFSSMLYLLKIVCISG